MRAGREAGLKTKKKKTGLSTHTLTRLCNTVRVVAEYVALNRIKPFEMSHTMLLRGLCFINIYSKKA